MFERVQNIVCRLLAGGTIHSHKDISMAIRSDGTFQINNREIGMVLTYDCPFDAAMTFVRIELN